MTRFGTRKLQGTVGGLSLGPRVVVPDRGFTLVEMTTSVAVLLIVMTASWLLMTSSNENLNRIDNGGQASELNRAALASFERDLGHGILPQAGVSAVLAAGSRSCSFMLDADNPGDHRPELVTWSADDTNHVLLRVVTRAPESVPTAQVTSLGSFEGGTTTTTTVLTGLASGSELASAPDLGQATMFGYAVSGTNVGSDLQHNVGLIGLVTFRLRNGLPDKDSNVIDRIGVFRVIALVINGY